MRYDDIEEGQRVIVHSRQDAIGIVLRKFINQSGDPEAYVNIDFGNTTALNYPHQISLAPQQADQRDRQGAPAMVKLLQDAGLTAEVQQHTSGDWAAVITLNEYDHLGLTNAQGNHWTWDLHGAEGLLLEGEWLEASDEEAAQLAACLAKGLGRISY